MKTVGFIAAVGLAIAAGPALAASVWTGGDDFPTSPLACGGGKSDAALPQATYNGAEPANKGAMAGKAMTVLHMPKNIGVGFFNTVNEGMVEAGKTFSPAMDVKYDGPTKANIDEQISFIDNYITKGVNGIMVSANDGAAIAPVLKKALGKGMTVVTYDSDAQKDARTWFVNQALHNGVAKALIDVVAEQTGGEGSFAIVTSTFTTPVQARWIAEMGAYTAKCYPKMKWLETVEAQEDNSLSFNQANQLINKYGDDLKAIIGMTSIATPAAAEAVQQAGKCGQIAVTGLTLPSTINPYLKSGCSKAAVLWSTYDLGYAAAQALEASANGTLKPGDKSFKAGRLGELKIMNGSEILLGDPLVFTKDNVDKYKF